MKKLTFTQKQLLFYKEAKKQFAQGPRGGRKNRKYKGLCLMLPDFINGDGPFKQLKSKIKNPNVGLLTDFQMVKMEDRIMTAVFWSPAITFFSTNDERLKFINSEIKRLTKK